MVLPFFFFLLDETATHAKQTKIWLCQVLHFFRMKCTPTCSILHYSWSILIMVLFHFSEAGERKCFFLFLSVWTDLGLNYLLRFVFFSLSLFFSLDGLRFKLSVENCFLLFFSFSLYGFRFELSVENCFLLSFSFSLWTN